MKLIELSCSDCGEQVGYIDINAQYECVLCNKCKEDKDMVERWEALRNGETI